MKFTLSWLKRHLDTVASADDISKKLTAIGLEVEGIEDRAAALAAFKVAKVSDAKQHPNADRLKVCTVETEGSIVQVVCGAPNARTGIKAIFAPPGSFIPGSGMELKAGTIRGEASNGMLVSEREMGLSNEHNGIIEVDEKWPVGTPIAEVLGLNDPVFDVNITPNRADCAGIRGIARDLAAAGLGKLFPLDTHAVKGTFPSPLKVAVDDATACPLFIGRYIKGVKNGPSPAWLQQQLKAIGLRPISALVDITNFLTYDLSRPLHVFDADLVKGKELRVSLSKGGEMMQALNDKVYELQPGMTVIGDSEGVEALGGVIGGTRTGCSEKTTNVFLEVALFDPIRTAATGRKLGIITDARYRFERGLDPAAVQDYAELATRLIMEMCGGEPSELVIVGKAPSFQRTYDLHVDRVLTLGGEPVEKSTQENILKALGFTLKASRDGWTVTPPSWRADIGGEADLVEEILRIHGYDHIPAIPLPHLSVLAKPSIEPRHRRVILARRTMAARGLLEALTFSFTSREIASQFGQLDPSLTLVNPISADLDTLRPSTLGPLLAAARRNADRGHPNVGLFEIGPVFRRGETDGQTQTLAALRTGMTPRHWASPAREVDALDAKADALAALEALGVPVANLQVSTDAPDSFHPFRSGCLRLGPTVLAEFGDIHPRVCEALGVKNAAAGCEIYLDRIPQPKKASAEKPYLTLAQFQPIERDFAFVLKVETPAEKLVRAVAGADKDLIAAVNVFDEYHGTGLPEGHKSLALAVTIQPREKTLTETEIDALGQKIIAAAAKTAGAELRK